MKHKFTADETASASVPEEKESDGSEVMPSDEIFSIVILKSKVESMRNAETYLKNRKWNVWTTLNMREVLMIIIQKQPQYILISSDHPNKKVLMLPKILASAFPVKVIAFNETQTPFSMKALQDMKIANTLYHPVSGPMVERLILKMKKDAELASQHAEEQAKMGLGTESYAEGTGVIMFKGQGASEQDMQASIEQARAALREMLAGDDSPSTSGGEGAGAQNAYLNPSGVSPAPTNSTSFGLENSAGQAGFANETPGAASANTLAAKAAQSHNPQSARNPQGGMDLRAQSSGAGTSTTSSGTGSSGQNTGIGSGNFGNAPGVAGNEGRTSPGLNARGSNTKPAPQSSPSGSGSASKGPGANSGSDAGESSGSRGTSTGSPGSDSGSRPGSSSGANSGQAGNANAGSFADYDAKSRKDSAFNGTNGESKGRDGQPEFSGSTPEEVARRRKEKAVPHFESGALKKKLTPTYKRDPALQRQNDSIMVRGTQQAMDESSVHIEGAETFNELTSPIHCSCIIVESDRFSGYLVAAMSRKEGMDENFVGMVRERLFNFLKSHGENIKEGSDSMKLKLQEVQFEDWAIEHADFLRKSIHQGGEVAMAFFPSKETDLKLEASASEKMLQLNLEDIKDDTIVEFDLFIYMPENNKYLLYTPEGRPLYSQQRARLKEKGVKHLHLRKEAAPNVKKYKAQNFLNEKIQAFKNLRAAGQ